MIEEIKLRAPIEEVVRERVPALKRAGQSYKACCPFHEEKTPSFSVSPSRGTWRCFGACAAGGDQISFLMQSDGLSFMEALEILAARTGVELPRKGRKPRRDDSGLHALDQASEEFQGALRRSEGRAALEYLERRGLTRNTIEAFGLGWAPKGSVLSRLAQRAGDKQVEAFLEAGLIRRADRGDLYDFFRGRLSIPIKDMRGQVVGFGARCLGDEGGPKYINSSETPWFHKSRVIYGLDRAIDRVRKSGEVVLVEGYTDVMAAHQVGLDQVVAVLGTSTTEDHAALLRRAGARRVVLVFDGDEAGKQAAYKALPGLLGLDAEIKIAVLEAGSDPCDLLIRDGSAAFTAQLEMARDWFDFLVEELRGEAPATLARGVDRALELFLHLRRPVHQAALVTALAEQLGLPTQSVRAQWDSLPARRRRTNDGRGRGARGGMGQAPGAQAGRIPPVSGAENHAVGPQEGAAGLIPDAGASSGLEAMQPRDYEIISKAFAEVVGAALCDPSLLPAVRPHVESCPDPDLGRLLHALLDLYETDDDVGLDALIARLGDDPLRDRAVWLAEQASTADDLEQKLYGSLESLRKQLLVVEQGRLVAEIRSLEAAASAGDEAAQARTDELSTRLVELARTGQPEAVQPRAARPQTIVPTPPAARPVVTPPAGPPAGSFDDSDDVNPEPSVADLHELHDDELTPEAAPISESSIQAPSQAS